LSRKDKKRKHRGVVDTIVLLAGISRFRKPYGLVVGVYYTTPEGFKDIGYSGNVPLESYPPITDEERAILEKALSALRL
jgi:hypothetical protein